jgi:DNA-binding MarR family transcriptional regulator
MTTAAMTTSATAPGAPGTEPGLADTLVRLSHLVQSVFIDVGRSHDLTPQQTRLLCLLSAGPTAMAELGPLLHLEKSSLTGLVDRVEQRGLVTRTLNATDRRALEIALTRRGADLALRAHHDVTERLEHLAGSLRAADRDRLRALIGRIVAGYGGGGSGHR